VPGSFEVKVPDEREIRPDGTRLLLEATSKHSGIWQVHKSDPDDIWPCDFHAHNCEDGSEVLNLNTGAVYDRNTRQVARKLPWKVCLFIYRDLARCREPEIASRCAALLGSLGYGGSESGGRETALDAQ
jgi:hypothetical protein